MPNAQVQWVLTLEDWPQSRFQLGAPESNGAHPRFPKIVAPHCRSRDFVDETTEGSD